MAGISDHVVVNISRKTKVPTRAGFGTPLIVGPNAVFSEKVRIYSTIDAVALDFATSSAEYKAASKYFNKSPRVTRVMIGKRSANVAQVNTITVGTVANSTAYTVTINGTAFTFTSDSSATTAEIIQGLVALINAGSEPVTAANVGPDTSITLTADVAGDAFTIAVTSNLVNAATTPNNGIAEQLALISAANNDWYVLHLTSHTEQDILAAAEYIEAKIKLYGTSSSDAGILAGTTSVLSKLKAKNYDRTWLVYHNDPDNEFPECGWGGATLPYTPGSLTWKFKEASGVTPTDSINETQENNVESDNGNTYMTVAGGPMFSEGKVVSGEFIDIMHGTDLIQARMQESVFGLFKNELKVPYTSAGIDAVKLAIQAPLNAAVTSGILKADPAPSVSAPEIGDISTADKLERFLDNVTFEGFYAGAVHKAKIAGSLSV